MRVGRHTSFITHYSTRQATTGIAGRHGSAQAHRLPFGVESTQMCAMIEPNADFRVESAVIISVGRHKNRPHPLFETILMKKSLFLLILPFLVVGCGSGGSSSGSGGACTITGSGLEVCATMFIPGPPGGGTTFSRDVDVVPTMCFDDDGMPDPTQMEGFEREVGTLTVVVQDRGITIPLISDQKRVTLQHYRVSYTGGPPVIMRTGSLTDFSGTSVLRAPSTTMIGVTLLAPNQIVSYNPDGFNPFDPTVDLTKNPFFGIAPMNYNMRVTFFGVDHPSDDPFTISAATEFAVGDFNNCM